MNRQMVEISEWYEGVKITKREINGIEVPLTEIDYADAIVVTQSRTMTYEQAKEIYGHYPEFNFIKKD
jgi:hypothetical protein